MLLLYHVFIIAACSCWYVITYGKPNKSILKHRLFAEKSTIIAILLYAIGICYGANFILVLAEYVLPASVVEGYQNSMGEAGFGQALIPTITALLIAPIGEELLFRGIILTYAGKVQGAQIGKRRICNVANLLQAGLFGVFHGNIIQGVYAFGIGLVLGNITMRFQSVVPAIIMHMLINGLSMFTWEKLMSYLPQNVYIYTISAILSLIFVLVGRKMEEKMK